MLSGTTSAVTPSASEDGDPLLPVLHVVLVGFHHKKGCQVEYAHPPLLPDAPSAGSRLPSQWRQLPALALPDGSHNYAEDTAYFHLPDLHNPRRTVFGISCYRQISADRLANRTADVTRTSVQKCVCVLSRLPLYGQIQVKMALITRAYFDEGDFTRFDLLHQTYDNLNACLTDDMLHSGQQLYVGLEARTLVRHWRQKVLVLFKLLLLERRVLFFQSPVHKLCGAFLTLLSLHPGMLERGLGEAARMVPAGDTPPSQSPCGEPLSLPPAAEAAAEEATTDTVEESPHVQPRDTKASASTAATTDQTSIDHQDQPSEPETTNDNHVATAASEETTKDNYQTSETEEDDRPSSVLSGTSSIIEIANEKVAGLKDQLSGALGYIAGYDKDKEDEEPANDRSSADRESSPAAEAPPTPIYPDIAQLPSQDVGLPLKIFTGGNLCHPYLSLSYLDILSQPSVHGYVIGATNILFKQKKGLADVVIDLEKDTLDVHDPELRRALTLTTEDLRFVDNLVKHVEEETTSSTDVFLDGVGWEGGDEWVRAQFRFYLLCLMRTSLLTPATDKGEEAVDQESAASGLFNASFMQMWRQTKNHRHWLESDGGRAPANLVDVLPAGHPFSGGGAHPLLSVTDMKLHISNTMANTERGKKVSQAMSNTGRAVAGGLSSARGAVSSFFTSFKNNRTPADDEKDETGEEVKENQ